MNTNIHETRSMTVIKHVNDLILSEKVSEGTFADDVKNIYHLRVQDKKFRVVKFHEGGDTFEDMKANAQLLFRMMKSHVKFPCDLEESVVLALPEERQRNLKAELAARYDLLAAPIPHNNPEDNVFSLAVLLKTTGSTIEALAPVIADGVIDEKDLPHAKTALTEINKTVASLISWQQAITAVLPD